MPEHPEFRTLLSDRAPGFKSKILKYFTEILGLNYWHSASLNPKGHSTVENCIKQLNHLIPKFADKDSMIEECLPLIQRVMNCSIPVTQAYSPYQIMRGQIPQMNLNGITLGEDIPVHSQTEYISWLKDRLKIIHSDVSKNTIDAKTKRNAAYNERNKTVDPTFKLGELVYLEDLQPKANSDQILTHRKFKGEYFITAIVQRPSTFVPSEAQPYPLITETSMPVAYQLTCAKTSKILKSLIPACRLKHFTPREDAFDKLHPPLPKPQKSDGTIPSSLVSTNQTPAVDSTSGNPPITVADNADMWHPAKCITRKKMIAGELHFLVKFLDKSEAWIPQADVSNELQRRFYLKTAALRRKRSKAARDMFRSN